MSNFSSFTFKCYLISVLALMEFWACAHAAPSSTATIGYYRPEVGKILPENLTYFSEVIIAKQVLQSIIEIDSVGAIRPAVADRWSISRDRKRYSLHIRDDLKFHDGRKLTVKDVYSSLMATMRSKKNTLYAHFQSIDSFTDCENICPSISYNETESMLTIQLEEPFSPFIRLLSRVFVRPSENPLSKNGHIIGSGPYRYHVRKRSDGKDDLILELNSNFKELYPKSIENFRILISRDIWLKKSDYGIEGIPDFDMDLLVSRKKLVMGASTHIISSFKRLKTAGIYININNPKNISSARRKAVLKTLYESGNDLNLENSDLQPLDDIFPKGVVGHQTNRASLQEMKARIKLSSEKYPSRMVIGATSHLPKEFIENIRRKGVEIVIDQLNPDEILTQLKQKHYDAFYLRWTTQFLDPISTFTPFMNVGIFDYLKKKSNISAAFREANREALFDKRVLRYKEIVDLIFENELFIPIWQVKKLEALKKGLIYNRTLYRQFPRLVDIRKKNS